MKVPKLIAPFCIKQEGAEVASGKRHTFLLEIELYKKEGKELVPITADSKECVLRINNMWAAWSYSIVEDNEYDIVLVPEEARIAIIVKALNNIKI